MTTNSSAGTEAKADGQEQAVAQPAGESHGGEGASGEESIPKSRFAAALKSQREGFERQIEDLKAHIAKAQEKPAVQPPTLAELRELVEAGKITQAQADATWDNQTKASVKSVAAAEAAQTVAAIEHGRLVQADLTAYRELVAAAWEEGTPEREKVAKEYGYLTGVLKMPATIETELAAMRNAFGDVDTLRASKTARAGPADTHTETGGGKPDTGGSKGSKDPVQSLPAHKRAYYQKQIDAGRYKDWGAVRAELTYTRPRG